MNRLEECAKACLECVYICNYCAGACLSQNHKMDMSSCIQLDMECASVCNLTAILIAQKGVFYKEMCKICVDICERCADECKKFSEMDHCVKCAEICYKCAKICKEMVA